ENLSCEVNGKKENGLKGEYFPNITLNGTPAITRTDRQVNFQWTLSGPGRGVSKYYYSARWTGKLKAPRTGKFKIGLDGNDGFRLYLNNKLIIDNWKKQTYSTLLADYSFEANKEYDIRVEFFEPVGNTHIKLIWNIGVQDDHETKIKEAVTAA